MSEFVQKRNIKLKFMTLVHIADGAEGDLSPNDYVISEKGEFMRINLPELISLLPEDSLAQLQKYLDQDDFIGTRNFIQTLWLEQPELFSDCFEYSMDAGDLRTYYQQLEEKFKESQLFVTPFIRTGGSIFLPGSSVKGAIRTAFVAELLGGEIDYSLKMPKIGKVAQQLEADILRCAGTDRMGWPTVKVSKEHFKALKISDGYVPSVHSIIKKVEVARKDKEGNFDVAGMEDMKIFAEFLKKDVEMEIEVRLDTRFFGLRGSIGRNISLYQITKSCESFYRRVLIHEKRSFFEGFDKSIGKSRISEFYDELLELNNLPGSFLLRIGRHSGRNSLSFNLINKRAVEPKTRKLIVDAGEYWPAGWVYVSGL